MTRLADAQMCVKGADASIDTALVLLDLAEPHDLHAGYTVNRAKDDLRKARALVTAARERLASIEEAKEGGKT